MTGHPRPGAGVPPATGLSWRLLAACQGAEDLFFGPAAESRPARDRRVTAASAICSGCPVRTNCGEFAAAFGVKFGVWSGEDRERFPVSPPEGATVLCHAELHWMTPENSKPVAGTARVRCRECLNVSDRRTAAARRARARDRAAGRREQVA